VIGEIKEPAFFPFSLRAAGEAEATVRTAPIENQNHRFWVVEYVLSGAGFVEIDGESLHPEADSVYLLSRGSNHRYWPDRERPWRKMFFVADGAFADELFALYDLSSFHYLADAAPLKHCFESLLELRGGDEDIHRTAAVFVHMFVAECARLRRREGRDVPPPEVEALRQQLEARVEGSFRLDEYAGETGISREHLIRLFRRHCGCTPYDYYMRRKIEIARGLLLYSGLSVKEIACRLNFSDASYFSNYFKRRTGVYPADFRRMPGSR